MRTFDFVKLILKKIIRSQLMSLGSKTASEFLTVLFLTLYYTAT